MTTDRIITTVFVTVVLFVFTRIVSACRSSRGTHEDNVIVRLPDTRTPPLRITTLTTVEWVDGAYQVVETRIMPIEEYRL